MAIAERILNLGLSSPSEPLFATARPTLWPHMLLPRARRAETMPFPFNQPDARYFFHGRNGVYEIVQLLGLGGKEILFPAYFQGVELEALIAAGGRPRFYPVHEKMRVDADEVIAHITKETRAIYLIHYAGFPGPVEELLKVCRERGLLLIEDCAHALLSSLGDRPLGSFGDAAIYCIYKMLPTPHGAVTVLHREFQSDSTIAVERPSPTSVASYAVTSMLHNLEMRGSFIGRSLRQAAMSWGKAVLKAAHVGEGAPVSTLEFDPAYLKLAMSPFTHTILRALDFGAIVSNRRRNYSHLLDRLRHLSPPVFDALPAGVCPLYYPFQTENKQEMMARLRERGAETLSLWRWSLPVLPEGVFPVVDELRRTVLWLPCHQDLTPAAIDRLATAVCDVAKEMR